MKFSYNILVFGGEPVEKSIARLARFGYQAVELVGEPELYDWEEVKKLCLQYSIEAGSICNIWRKDRDFTSKDPAVRANAKEYTKKTIDMASCVGAKVVIVAPTANMRVVRELPPEEEWKFTVEGIRECGEYAEKKGVTLVIEPWNRFETYLINRLSQAIKLAQDVGLPNVKVMGDLFHMNIEEANIPQAILDAGDWLVHMHVADNQRDLPGKGHLDWREIVGALKAIGFQGYLVLEYIPPFADLYFAFRHPIDEAVYDEHVRYAIEFLRQFVR
ncbi:MAG: sugar phosphate isomerase/epimerase family protein [Candidatus Caldatribacteriaceae bacterium]